MIVRLILFIVILGCFVFGCGYQCFDFGDGFWYVVGQYFVIIVGDYYVVFDVYVDIVLFFCYCGIVWGDVDVWFDGYCYVWFEYLLFVVDVVFVDVVYVYFQLVVGVVYVESFVGFVGDQFVDVVFQQV